MKSGLKLLCLERNNYFVENRAGCLMKMEFDETSWMQADGKVLPSAKRWIVSFIHSTWHWFWTETLSLPCVRLKRTSDDSIAILGKNACGFVVVVHARTIDNGRVRREGVLIEWTFPYRTDAWVTIWWIHDWTCYQPENYSQTCDGCNVHTLCRKKYMDKYYCSQEPMSWSLQVAIYLYD